MQVHFGIEAVEHGVFDILNSFILEVTHFSNFIRDRTHNFDRFLECLEALWQEVETWL